MLMNRRAAAVDQCPSARTEEPQMSDMPLILVAVMFDKNNKAMAGFDVWTVTTAEHFDTAKEIDELDRNLVFLQFNSFRIGSR